MSSQRAGSNLMVRNELALCKVLFSDNPGSRYPFEVIIWILHMTENDAYTFVLGYVAKEHSFV